MSRDERTVRGFTRRIEAFANRVAGKKLFSGEGLQSYIDLQENLFNLQMEVQRAIGEVKQRGKKDSDTLSHLEQLRRLRWLTRRLGDSIAWGALLYNRQVIYALNKNAPIPVPSSWSDGHRGAFQFAKAMTNPEWGIPIVHDITNMLRVGDVTFMRPMVPVSDTVYRTIELKTTRVGASIDENGATTLNLNVTAIANEPFPADFPPDQKQPAAPLEMIQKRRPDRRIERQMARMNIATASKNARLNEITKIGDQHVFSFQLPKEQEPHWKELRRAIRSARKDGFAYFELGGFVGYSVLYNTDGVTLDDITASPIPEHVTRLTHEEIGSRNSITISAFPDEADDSFSSLVLPFYLWEVPQRAIRDILRHRLMIWATYNSGWMEKLLEDAGMIINAEDVPGKDSRDFEVVAPLLWDNGHGDYHTGAPWEEMYIAVHEFRGPKAVVQRVTAASSFPEYATIDHILATGPGTPLEAS